MDASIPGKRSIAIQCERQLVTYYTAMRLSPAEFEHYTGVTQDKFELLYDFFGGDAVCSRLKYKYNAKTPQKEVKSLLTPRDRMFMTLLRLRRGVPIGDLALLFASSTGFVSECVFVWIRFMALQFRRLEKFMFLSRHAQKNKPQVFTPFPNLRVIIDATEFSIQTSKNFRLQSKTFSTYKGRNTVKVLVGISLCGGISFLSSAFDGSISDKEIVLQSGFMDYLEPGDAVMADRGFNMEAEFNAIDVELIIPPFLGGRTHLSAGDELRTKAIAGGRVFVENVILLLKRFRLLKLPISNKLLPVLSDVVCIAGNLVNLMSPIPTLDAM